MWWTDRNAERPPLRGDVVALYIAGMTWFRICCYYFQIGEAGKCRPKLAWILQLMITHTLVHTCIYAHAHTYTQKLYKALLLIDVSVGTEYASQASKKCVKRPRKEEYPGVLLWLGAEVKVRFPWGDRSLCGTQTQEDGVRLQTVRSETSVG